MGFLFLSKTSPGRDLSFDLQNTSPHLMHPWQLLLVASGSLKIPSNH